MQTQENTAEAPVGVLESSDALAPGMLCGPWRVEREIGRGGMGAVYAVVHSEIGKHAALKVIHRRLVTTAAATDRMLLEAQVVNRVGHPNIVDIFETGHLPDGRNYLVMERLEGLGLAHRADTSRLQPDDVIAILLQVCDALIAAHAVGVIHRDLKLDNVFLVDNPEMPSVPRVKLLDWGIAKEMDDQGQRHTIDGQLVGTPQYLSPEQARGAAVSAKTDVYSLGVMAYELFLDQLPFEAETAAEIMTMHLRATPPPASDLWPEIPPALEELIHAMLAKCPTARPTVLEVAHRLEAIRPAFGESPPHVPIPRRSTQRPIAERPVSEPQPAAPARSPKQPRWQWVIGASALVILAMLFVIGQRPESEAAAAVVDAPAREPVGTPRLLTAKPLPLPDLAPPPAIESVARIEPAVTTASPPTPTIIKRSSAVNRTTKLAPAAPRRNAKQDPDGTLDPYK